MRFKILIIITLFVSIVFGQSASEAESLFNNKQYAKAQNIYESFLKKKPKDALYNYRYARCCYELKEYDLAIKHFEISGNRYALRDLYLGELYYNVYRFEDSKLAYETYLATLDAEDKNAIEIQNKLKTVDLAMKLINRVLDVAIVDSVLVNKNEFLRYYHFGSDLGSITQQRIKINAKQTSDKISYTTQRGDRQCYSDSTRGNMDIFSSYKLLDEWSKPISISSTINTKANENYPFIMLDGITMYFAADGENSLGGYDLFITKYNSSIKDYLKPENIGFPFNSPANDYMMVVDEIHQVGWFATDRNQASNKVMIYKFISSEDKQYFRTEDNDLLRKVAALDSYRKAQNPVSNYSPKLAVENEDAEIFFVLNDSTVYKHFDEFQSVSALDKYKDWFKLSKELGKQKVQIVDLRLQYDATLNADEKKSLSEKIIALEKSIIENENLSNKMLVESGNEELKFVQNL